MFIFCKMLRISGIKRLQEVFFKGIWAPLHNFFFVGAAKIHAKFQKICEIRTLRYFSTLLQELLYNYYHCNDVFSGFRISYLCRFIVFYILGICQVIYFTICVILLRVHIIPKLLPCNSKCSI